MADDDPIYGFYEDEIKRLRDVVRRVESQMHMLGRFARTPTSVEFYAIKGVAVEDIPIHSWGMVNVLRGGSPDVETHRDDGTELGEQLAVYNDFGDVRVGMKIIAIPCNGGLQVIQADSCPIVDTGDE